MHNQSLLAFVPTVPLLSYALLISFIIGQKQATPVCPHDIHPSSQGYWDAAWGKCFTWLNVENGGLPRTYDNDMLKCAEHFFNGVVAPVAVSYFSDILEKKREVHSSAYMIYKNLPAFWEGKKSSWILNGNRIIAVSANITNSSLYSVNFTLKNPLNKTTTSTTRSVSGNRVCKVDITGLPLSYEPLIALINSSLKYPHCMKYQYKLGGYSPMKLTSCTSGSWDGLICASAALNNCVVDYKKSTDRCTCRRGYSGRFCEIEINQCDSNPCGSPDQCVNAVEDFFCKCFDGFFSKNCNEGPPEQGLGWYLLILFWMLFTALFFLLIYTAVLAARILFARWKRANGSPSSSSRTRSIREGQRRRSSLRRRDRRNWKRFFFRKKGKSRSSKSWDSRSTARAADQYDNDDDDKSFANTSQSVDSDKTDKRKSVSTLLLEF
ncbi:protocadherin Fat 4 [Trichuris trichiura]|uniref:Protocadherin Fat 4 n=1 Tax=Trichuris trichiura TaxID=36087 RepID=A0A077Z496_TRITR|nr:protocadherin Fat 4 [Trichuris trichiura]